MEYLRLFENFNGYLSSLQDLPNIAVSYLENEDDVVYGSILPQDGGSYIRCTYDMTDAFSGDTKSVTLMSSDAISGYKINAENSSKELTVIDGIYETVTTSSETTYYYPKYEACMHYGDNPHDFIYKINRPINFNTDYVNYAIYSQDSGGVWVLEEVRSVPASLLTQEPSFVWHNDTTYSLNDLGINQINDMLNSGLAVLLYFSDNNEQDNYSTQLSSIHTVIYNFPSQYNTGDVVIRKDILDENNTVTVDYRMPDDVSEIPVNFNHSSNNAVAAQCITSVDFSGLSDKKEWTMNGESPYFSRCPKLTKINMGKISSIVGWCCYEIRNLTEWIPSDKMKSYSASAFYGCNTTQETITFPETLEFLGGFGFPVNSNFTSVTFLSKTPPTLTASGSSSINFDFEGDYPIYVPAESVNLYKTAELWDYYVDRIQPIEE